MNAPFTSFRTGARTRAVLASPAGVTHRFVAEQERVLVKLYKGSGDTSGSREYRRYHRESFHRIPALATEHVQRSLAGGVLAGVGPYAVLQYVEGDELAERLERRDLTPRQASRALEHLLLGIWVPLWSAGLRFKDCHPGNFVMRPDGRIVMIDTEQMRKDAIELLDDPDCWVQRDAHQRSGLSRLPRLVARVIEGAMPEAPRTGSATVRRSVAAALASSKLPDHLASLGRTENARRSAERACERFLADLRHRGCFP